jgi:hypothetical protein
MHPFFNLLMYNFAKSLIWSLFGISMATPSMTRVSLATPSMATPGHRRGGQRNPGHRRGGHRTPPSIQSEQVKTISTKGESY